MFCYRPNGQILPRFDNNIKYINWKLGRRFTRETSGFDDVDTDLIVLDRVQESQARSQNTSLF